MGIAKKAFWAVACSNFNASILPTFVKNDKISYYYFLFKKKILMRTYFIESSNFSCNFN
jgi:hypothetical protein